jgi:hypothetical protein
MVTRRAFGKVPRNGQYNPTVMDTPELKKAREEMRQWRLNTPMSYWQGIRKRFDAAGIELIGYSLTLADDFTDEEMDRLHNHTLVNDPNEIASIESLHRVMDMSPFFKVNLDIGHFTAANLNAVEYIQKHHRQITYLHLKDRRRNEGPNAPWGQGDTPVKEVLQLIKKERYPIPAVIEYEYMSDRSAVDEVKKCMDFIRQALA